MYYFSIILKPSTQIESRDHDSPDFEETNVNLTK